MKIRSKFILSIIVPVICSVVGISSMVFVQIGKTVTEQFAMSSQEELQLVDGFVGQLLKGPAETAQFVASLPELRNGVGDWTRYFELPEAKNPVLRDTMGTKERAAFQTFNRLMASHPDYMPMCMPG